MLVSNEEILKILCGKIHGIKDLGNTVIDNTLGQDYTDYLYTPCTATSVHSVYHLVALGVIDLGLNKELVRVSARYIKEKLSVRIDYSCTETTLPNTLKKALLKVGLTKNDTYASRHLVIQDIIEVNMILGAVIVGMGIDIITLPPNAIHIAGKGK